MESNRDEADKCLELALKFIKEGNKVKAEKFVRKAEKLFPSRRIQEVLNLVQQMSEEEENDGNGASHIHQRKSNIPSDNEEASTSNANFTQDQVEAVKRIRKCKNYYEILGVGKDVSDSELKKSYRKLALAFHPDKNKAPGASEAFKAIGNAYAVLSDTEKKRQYDLYGDEDVSSPRSRGGRHGFYEYDDPSHGFQGDMTAEEIFNMFFGGGMPGSNVYVRRGGRWHRQGQNSDHQNGHSHSNSHHGDASGFSAIFQLMPILLLILVSMLSSLLVSLNVIKVKRDVAVTKKCKLPTVNFSSILLSSELIIVLVIFQCEVLAMSKLQKKLSSKLVYSALSVGLLILLMMYFLRMI